MVFVQSSLTREELPPDAILLIPSEALEYRKEAIDNLDFKYTWPLEHGRKIVGFLTGAQAFYVLSKFQRKLRLGNYGIYSVKIPFVLGPFVFSNFFHLKCVSDEIILEKQCSICLFTQSVLATTIFGSAFSGLGGGLASLWYAHNLGTYNLPARKWSNLLVFGQQILNLNKPLVPIYWIYFAFNIVSSYAMITLEERSMQKINEIFAERDFELAKRMYLQEQQRRYRV